MLITHSVTLEIICAHCGRMLWSESGQREDSVIVVQVSTCSCQAANILSKVEALLNESKKPNP